MDPLVPFPILAHINGLLVIVGELRGDLVAAFVIQEDLVNVVAVEVVVVVNRVALRIMPLVYYHRHLDNALDPQVDHAASISIDELLVWGLATFDLFDLDVLVRAFVGQHRGSQVRP